MPAGYTARTMSCATRFATRTSLLALLVAITTQVAHADTYPRQPGVDAIHYVFRLSFTDNIDEIAGDATVTVKLAAGVSEVVLDLISAVGGKGMSVAAVTVGGKPVQFAHQSDRLRVPLPKPSTAGEEIAVGISYRGIPAQGLRIINNIHGERTAFSENWPNRARHWLPMIDHPYDKATGEFVVTAPAQYQVVANGLLVEELDMPAGQRRTHWKQSVPIASWLYALGWPALPYTTTTWCAGFRSSLGVSPGSRQGLRGLRGDWPACVEFFSDLVGPYAYEKLGHVQAAGLGGGTEHASAIFYGEKGVASGRAPVVHEVAHQWFGNAVTEKDWDDVWLSEGFATYFTHLYTEQFEGREAMVRGLRNDIETITQAQRSSQTSRSSTATSRI